MFQPGRVVSKWLRFFLNDCDMLETGRGERGPVHQHDPEAQGLQVRGTSLIRDRRLLGPFISSLIRNRLLLEPYSRPLPRVLGGSYGNGYFL